MGGVSFPDRLRDRIARMSLFALQSDKPLLVKWFGIRNRSGAAIRRLLWDCGG
jgi:hypothetical protein